MTVEDAARWAELIVLAVPWRTPEALPAAEAVVGKIVVDAMNPYRNWGGTFDLGESSSSEETMKRLPGARLVKAFNTIFFRHLATEGRVDVPEDDRRAIFVASDDGDAKETVSQIIRQLGFAPIDAGMSDPVITFLLMLRNRTNFSAIACSRSPTISVRSGLPRSCVSAAAI